MDTSHGRPQDSGNRSYQMAKFGPSRCPRCGSTQRRPYFGSVTQAFEGYTADGQPYTHIVRRRTRCDDCGQFRVDTSHENRPGKPKRRRPAAGGSGSSTAVDKSISYEIPPDAA